MRIVEGNKSKSGPRDREPKGHEWGAGEPTRALVLCPSLHPKRRNKPGGQPGRYHGGGVLAPEARLAEAEGLAQAIGLKISSSGLVPVTSPRPATLFGTGKVEELHGLIAAEKIKVVVVDHALTPVQQRNLEKAWHAKVLDRTGLILEIFGKRARTREGTLQVELAHLTYQKSRLVRTWTHLERQRGGYGFLGGPGERQIEADRRMIQERIDAITRELEAVKRTRRLHRDSRKRVPYPVVALVGYTNAGKSTLFNRLTGADVFADDLLFATLDPTMRELALPGGSKIILSDTVGFISSLPTALIAAFRATLEEVVEADLILLVRDIADKESEAQLADVEMVLGELGIDSQGSEASLIEIWNKIDLLDADRAGEMRMAAKRNETRAICISAETGEGVDDLLAAIETILNATHETLEVTIEPGEGALANWLHENAEILTREPGRRGEIAYRIRLSPAKRAALSRRLEKIAQKTEKQTIKQSFTTQS